MSYFLSFLHSPEALGIVPGAVFLVTMILCCLVTNRLADLNAALLAICFMLFLGFTDDVLEWPWRYKLVLPTVASLPLLCCYTGSTSVVVPTPLRMLLWYDDAPTSLAHLASYLVVVDADAQGAIVNLGLFYYLYMGMLAVFCTNAINILAGINGLEAGQSYVIGCAVLFHNLWEIHQGNDNHIFSAMIMLSFVGVTLGLLRYNWFPATVFVGDTYCYFAGMVFASAGILGHFSKTLLLFFIPQILNFLWSVPQLFRFVPCPRHRLPRYNAALQKMQPSIFVCAAHEYKWLKTKSDDTQGVNMTIPNVFLQVLGPLSERDLCLYLMIFQVVCCAFGMFCRYHVAQYLFDQ